ncbi:uncharacterized protein EAF02_008800 [Botrytis sinoallii]|uniref:uncharacterized protein n=1 Tax=Botrytis sinoallii TaxID=1463999 RepID=UPI001902881C|nr:uncharacterized protein EAF02_008800 [Botrytis sinoallii]KAF7872729.1 hypothetical protein EAF02_008800 [Botrytis sinoallii]
MATILFNEGHPGPKYAQDAPTKKQLLNNIIDGMARTRPNALWAVTPISSTSYSEGFRKVTYSALANAVNGIAWWLTDQLGSGFGKDFPTICYMGWNDLRYVTMVLGAVKAGYKILLVSPYNSNEGNTSLFNALDCQVLATTDPVPIGVPVLRTITVPNVSELLDKSYKHFPFSKTFDEAKDEPLVCLHTSGTTGLPKPVIYPHGFVSTYMRMAQLASPEGFESREKQYQGTRVFMNLPPFHASISSSFNYLFEVMIGIKHKRTIRITSQSEHCHIPSTNGTSYRLIAGRDYETHASRRTMCTSMDGTRDCDQSRNLRRIDGPETRRYMSGEWPAEDWKYQCTHPAAGLEYRAFSDDDQLYEAVIVRNSDPEFEQPVFKLYPDLNEYSTKDLFSPHPTKEGLWTYRGRTDDMILVVVDNVATRPFNPQFMEHAVTNHPDVKDGVMVPAGKFFNERFATKTALLVDLKDSIDATALGYEEKLIEEIWTIVNGINEKYREEAWVRKECIMIAKPQKPLPRSPKGSIQRARAMELYAKELESL